MINSEAVEVLKDRIEELNNTMIDLKLKVAHGLEPYYEGLVIDCETEIEALEFFLEDDWVSVETDLPKKHQTVNVKFKDGRYSSCWIQGHGRWAYNTDDSITHWKPLDIPTKENKNDYR